MREPLFEVWLIIGILVIINLFFLLPKKDYKFLVYPGGLWIFSILAMFVIAPIHNNKVKELDKAYSESSEGKNYGDREIWGELKSLQEENVKIKITLLYFAGIQTIMTFIFQIIGFKLTQKRKMYKWTAHIFGILAVLYVLIQILVEIIPLGPFF